MQVPPKKKKWTYVPSDNVKKHIAKWEASDFAKQNELFGGDAIGAKAKEFSDLFGDKGKYFTSNELDGIFSTYYNLSPSGFNKHIMPHVDAYVKDPSEKNLSALTLRMRNRYTIAPKLFQRGIKRRANADADLMNNYVYNGVRSDDNKVLNTDVEYWKKQGILKPMLRELSAETPIVQTAPIASVAESKPVLPPPSNSTQQALNRGIDVTPTRSPFDLNLDLPPIESLFHLNSPEEQLKHYIASTLEVPLVLLDMPMLLPLEKFENGKKPFALKLLRALLSDIDNIPFDLNRKIKLTNAGLATGAVLSENLLDEIADAAYRLGLPIKTAIGLAVKESTLGNPTDDTSIYKILSPKNVKMFKQFGTGSHINSGHSLMARDVVNYHRDDDYPLEWNSFDRAFRFYKDSPEKYNPGQKNYRQLVDKRADETWESPEIQNWYKQWEKKQLLILQPDPYKVTTDFVLQDYVPTLRLVLPKHKCGKLPKYADGDAPIRVGNYNVYPSAIGASELNVTTPEVVITGKDRRPVWRKMYENPNLGNTSLYFDRDVIKNITEWVPGISDVQQGFDAYNAFRNKDYLLAGVLGGLLLLPNAVEKPLKTVGKVIKPALSDLTEYTYKGFNLLTNDEVFKKMKLMAAFAELEGRKYYDYFGDNLVKKGKKYSEYPSVVNLVLKNSIYPRMREMRPLIKDSEFDRMFNTTADNKWTMHPIETFKSAYGDESGVIGLYTPDTGNIAVKAGGGGEDISDILLHEIRHKLDDGVPLTEEETKILKEAYGDKFLEIPKISKDWEATGIGEDYDMWSEAVTTNRDARSALLGPKERYMNVHQQNQIIDKMSDQQIVEAVANANGYGRRFVDNLIGDGPLDASLISKEQIKAWREAMKKVGMFSGAAYSISNVISEYKNGKSPIHIKKENRGKFTALKKRTGHSASWFKAHGTPALKKMAVFELNSKKWKH